MNATRNSKTMTATITRQFVALASPETESILALGRENSWNFTVLGQAPMPVEPTRLGNWLISPAHLDSSPLPESTSARVQAIFTAGLRPKGFVMVHEAPLLLGSGKKTDPKQLRLPLLPQGMRTALKVAGYGLGGIAAMLALFSGLLVVGFLAAVIAVIVLLPASMLAGVAVLDPILVAVTADDYWIEIDRWEN